MVTNEQFNASLSAAAFATRLQEPHDVASDLEERAGCAVPGYADLVSGSGACDIRASTRPGAVQGRGGEPRVHVSTDLFAVGVTLYELLCDGNHPYPQSRPMLGVDPTDPRKFRKDLDESLAVFLLQACAPGRASRFQAATQMKAALEAVRASL